MSKFTISTLTIMHLFYPPKSCITTVLDFSWGNCKDNNGYAKLWGVNKMVYDLCENGECRNIDEAWRRKQEKILKSLRSGLFNFRWYLKIPERNVQR